MSEHFPNIKPISYVGPHSHDLLGFHYYEKDRKILGKTMEDHLRCAVCYWHTFTWMGTDPFGGPTFFRSWEDAKDPMKRAELKADAAFEFYEKLNVPFFCFHDRDIAPEGLTLEESNRNVQHIGEIFQQKMEKSKVKLLWGTANLFSNKRYMSGAATNPNPEVFAYACAQVKNVLDLTHALKGENYVFWGGREGYETILNTDMKREQEQLARFFDIIVSYKHKIGFKGLFLIEPKPCEPTKHQYDFDCASVHAFLQKFGLDKEFKMNIEANHATLAGHTFSHEIAYAIANDLFGSIDANQGDSELGWDTDQFPMHLQNIAYAVYLIVRHGGFTSGGFNFDAKVRRQSIDVEDLFYGHIAGMDTLARGLLIAEKMIKDDFLQKQIENRYQGWNQTIGKKILQKQVDLEAITNWVKEQKIDPKPISGRQEMLEGYCNNQIF